MTKTLLTIFLLLLPGGLAQSTHAAPASATAARYDTATSTAAQDGTGTVWALPDASNRDDKIRQWQAGTWVSVAVPEARGFRLLALTTGGAGNVYGLWQKPAQGQYGQEQNTLPACLVTVQHGTSIKALAQFDGPVLKENGFPNTPKIYAGTGSDVWIAGYQPELRHITSDGAVQTLTLKPEWFTYSASPRGFEDVEIGSVADSAGRRWFWSEKPFFGFGNPLRGALLWNGKALDLVKTNLPDGRISGMARLDANHLWVGVDGNLLQGALYRLDTRTFQAVREPLPADFQSPVQLFQAGGEWYALDAPRFGSFATGMWRRRGGWHTVIAPLEEPGGYYAPSLQHPWMAEPSGLWIGASGGAWWLPRGNAAPLWVNWQRGLPPLGVISALFPLAGSRLLAVSDTGGAAEIAAAPEPSRPLPPGVIVGGLGAPINIVRPLADVRQHLWAAQIYETRTPSLDEWDGRQWRIHTIPKMATRVTGLYACDTQGRIWMTTTRWNTPSEPQPVSSYAVYDPAHDAWTNYATDTDALGAAASLPGMGFLPYRDTSNLPVFSGDGRVAYLSDNTQVSLYDGKAWHHWRTGEILRNYGGNIPNLVHFNADRCLEVGFGGPKCEWTPETGWQQDGQEEAVKYQNPVPPGGPKGLFWGNPGVDSLGVKWFVWQDMVYAAGYGLWAKQPELSASGSPFTQGFGIEDVLRDPAGRFFFVSRPAGRYEFVVWSPPPVPKPTVSVTPLSEDSVLVRFKSALPGLHWLLWRVNGGAWSAPATEKTLALTALPRGDYRLEVQALDSRLQASPSAAAVWSIRVAPEAQITRWVSALSAGPDDAREIAVAGLTKQPAAALPALKAARPGASELGRWWIDAAMQQISDEPQISAGETPEVAN